MAYRPHENIELFTHFTILPSVTKGSSSTAHLNRLVLNIFPESVLEPSNAGLSYDQIAV